MKLIHLQIRSWGKKGNGFAIYSKMYEAIKRLLQCSTIIRYKLFTGISTRVLYDFVNFHIIPGISLYAFVAL